jgi:Domain of unknown function (DUF4174)
MPMTSRRAFVLALGGLAAGAAPAAAIPASDARLARMKTMIGVNRTALLDRDLTVVYVIGGELSHDLGPPPGLSAGAVRTLYRASEGAFRVLLIGKDGGIKLDNAQPITASDLTAEIDRMPMRRDEMRRRSSDRP